MAPVGGAEGSEPPEPPPPALRRRIINIAAAAITTRTTMMTTAIRIHVELLEPPPNSPPELDEEVETLAEADGWLVPTEFVASTTK
jgi:hypothetical protein